MVCEDAIKYIHSLERFGIKPGLERISLLCEKLGNPQNSLKFVHVAGTNGKGSTSTMIACALKEAGYRTGLYTSPYVVDFRERIQFDGRMIFPDELADAVETVRNTAEENNIEATEFEFITAAAFVYFARMKCDYVVLEVGLGGRFDATNVIPAPEVAVIACISMDHTEILGDTLEKIAGEKCGIIKPGTKVVSYPLQQKEALDVITAKCRECGVPLTVPDNEKLKITEKSALGTDVSYCGTDYHLKLAGNHMVYNSLAAYEALKILGVDDESIKAGFGNAVLPARMEILSEEPLVILEGGHNEDCANALKNYAEQFLEGRKIIMVSSIMADKDYETYARIAIPLASEFIAAKADVPRALDAETYRKCAEKYCSDCYCEPCSKKAFLRALNDAESGDVILVCGSFYLAGEIRDFIIERTI